MHQEIGDAVAKLYRESRAEGGAPMGPMGMWEWVGLGA